MNGLSRRARTALPRKLLTVSLLAALALPALAQQAPAAPSAPSAPELARQQAEAERQAVEAQAAEAYAKALESAEAEQREALQAVESARRELAQRAEERARLNREVQQRAEESQAQAREARELAREARETQREENRRISEELERAHENLRRASREVARVHRDLHRVDTVVAPRVRFGEDRAVIGVILGDGGEDGVKVIGLSPDGPAERAGLEQGDLIVSLMGESLTGEGIDGRVVLGEAMEAVEPGDELVVVVSRDGQRIEKIVTAEERTPFAWHSVTRLSSVPAAPAAPGAPSAPVIVQSIEVPRVDRERLEKELEGMRQELENRRIVIDADGFADGDEFVYEFETFSDVAGTALAGANIWFGMPLTRGLKLTELEEGLGAYFDTDRGVLVLQARDDNALQLQTGDVILSVNGDTVTRPADVVRALRDVDSGATVDIEVKRQRRNETLEVVIPENRVGQYNGFDWRVDGLDEDHWELHFAPHADHD